MTVAIAVWSIALTPGAKQGVSPPGDVRITNVALGDTLADESGRSTVKLTYETPADPEVSDEEESAAEGSTTTTILCSLTPGKIEQATVDIVLDSDENYIFEVTGKNTVYLTGNYIDQLASDQPPFDDSEEDEDEEEAFNLEDVSSDVEIDPDDLEMDDDSHRFEEVADSEIQKSLKRPRDSDTAANEASEETLTKSQKKKLNKKLKAANGQAVATGPEEKAADEKEGKEKKKPGQKEKDKKDSGEKEADKAKGASRELPGGIKIRDVQIGTGKAAKNGDQVSMRYIGKLPSGKVFDKNTKGQPFRFRLGGGEVIKGWDIGIAGMQVGGERELSIPPKLAYGNKAQSGIPAGSTLIFEVKLIEIK